jgi:hypothetical protein
LLLLFSAHWHFVDQQHLGYFGITRDDRNEIAAAFAEPNLFAVECDIADRAIFDVSYKF